MTVVLIVLALIAVVAFEVRADRKVRRSTAGATPVVIVRGLKPRWWRGLVASALSGLLTLAILAGLVLAALRLSSSGPVTDYSHPTTPAAPTPTVSRPSPTSNSSTPTKERMP